MKSNKMSGCSAAASFHRRKHYSQDALNGERRDFVRPGKKWSFVGPLDTAFQAFITIDLSAAHSRFSGFRLHREFSEEVCFVIRPIPVQTFSMCRKRRSQKTFFGHEKMTSDGRMTPQGGTMRILSRRNSIILTRTTT